MASRVTNKRSGTTVEPTSLELNLHAPGMSPLHRAGLGGLAATLRAMERRHRRGRLSDEQLPKGPDLGGGYPWRIEPTKITLAWDEPTDAEKYLCRLFAFAFGLRDGLIDLPGTYRTELSMAVRAELQRGLLLTFLQHGKTRTLATQPAVVEIDPSGDGTQRLTVDYRPCSHYRHQDEWRSLVDGKSRLVRKPINVEGPLAPGAVVRHNAFSSHTKIEDPPERAICLIFSLVGCLSLAINRGMGALLIPEVEDLRQFADDRPRMTPATVLACRIGGAGDAALQAMLRLRGRRLAHRHGIAGLHVNLLAPTAWASQQKTRIDARYIPARDPDDDPRLRKFDQILRHLPPRVRSRQADLRAGRQKIGTETVWFTIDSVIRPLAADNLADDQPWYRNFIELMKDPDQRRAVEYERKGLSTMVDSDTNQLWGHEMERNVVRAVHAALSRRFGDIADQYKHNQAGRDRKWSTEYERWRLAFAGSKTANQFRNAFCDLLSRAGGTEFLRDHWHTLLPMISDDKWELCRDLALLALPSYPRSRRKDLDQSDDPKTTDESSSTETCP